jgi:hypothetical protein
VISVSSSETLSSRPEQAIREANWPAEWRDLLCVNIGCGTTAPEGDRSS